MNSIFLPSLFLESQLDLDMATADPDSFLPHQKTVSLEQDKRFFAWV